MWPSSPQAAPLVNPVNVEGSVGGVGRPLPKPGRGDTFGQAGIVAVIDRPPPCAAFVAKLLIAGQKVAKAGVKEADMPSAKDILPRVFGLVRDAIARGESPADPRNPKALANKVYANRNGNGNEESGDGWTYRGRGLFQLTGRANYKAASEGCGLGAAYLWRPDLVAMPSDACLTAAWYWRVNGANQAIDNGMFDATTKAINGPAMMHRQERAAAFAQALEVFNGSLE